MRYILVLIFACISLCYTYETVNAEKARYPFSKGGFNVNAAATWGNEVFTGQVFFVDSGDSNARDDKSHGMKRAPYATMDFADGLCAANNGDLVVVLPGHVETVTAAAGLDLNTAGVTWRGIGHGSNTPTIKFTTATTADMNIDGANITLVNFLFEARVNLLAAPIDINAADCVFINVECRDITVAGKSSIGSATSWIVTDANADRLFIDNFKLIGTDTIAAGVHPISGISLTGGDDIILRNINIYGNFAYGNIMVTATPCTRLTIGGFNTHNQLWTENSTDTVISALTSTGFIGPNIACMLADNAANLTGAVRGVSMQYIKPIQIVNLAGESSTNTTITESTN